MRSDTPLPADDLDPADRIGPRIAALRAQRGWPVAELARRAGVSASLVGQIERGQSRPSVTTLVALARAVDVSVDALFQAAPFTAADPPTALAAAPPPSALPDLPPEPPHRYVVRRGKRRVIDIEGGVRWEQLTPATLDRADVLEIVHAPYAVSHNAGYRHPGSEMVLVLSGRLRIEIDGEHYDLDPGDSIWFPSMCEHRYVNPTGEETRAVVARIDGRPPRA